MNLIIVNRDYFGLLFCWALKIYNVDKKQNGRYLYKKNKYKKKLIV